MRKKKINYKKELKLAESQIAHLRTINEFDKRKIQELEQDKKRLLIRNREDLAKSLGSMIDANAHLTQFVARILEPGKF